MRNAVVLSVAAAALFAPGLPLTAGDEARPISVDLKSVKFKVGDDQTSLFGYNQEEDKLFFYTNGPAEVTVKIPEDGNYEIVLKASCDSAQNERAKFKLSLDGQPVGKETLLTADEAKEYKLTEKLKAGQRKLVVEFTNDAFKENEFDRNLYIHSVTLRLVK
jgi:Ca-dependent carbohydrate-binding module xylan-binding